MFFVVRDYVHTNISKILRLRKHQNVKPEIEPNEPEPEWILKQEIMFLMKHCRL